MAALFPPILTHWRFSVLRTCTNGWVGPSLSLSLSLPPPAIFLGDGEDRTGRGAVFTTDVRSSSSSQLPDSMSSAHLNVGQIFTILALYKRVKVGQLRVRTHKSRTKPPNWHTPRTLGYI